MTRGLKSSSKWFSLLHIHCGECGCSCLPRLHNVHRGLLLLLLLFQMCVFCNVLPRRRGCVDTCSCAWKSENGILLHTTFPSHHADCRSNKQTLYWKCKPGAVKFHKIIFRVINWKNTAAISLLLRKSGVQSADLPRHNLCSDGCWQHFGPVVSEQQSKSI